MTPKERAAMELALEALLDAQDVALTDMCYHDEITALREALEQPVSQEPVAWRSSGGIFTPDRLTAAKWVSNGGEAMPLYDAPVRTKDLTDDEIRFWIGRFPFLLNEKSEEWVIGLTRAVIAADREKNNG